MLLYRGLVQRDYRKPETILGLRILELGKDDWCWNESDGHSWKFQDDMDYTKFGESEQVLNYIVK